MRQRMEVVFGWDAFRDMKALTGDKTMYGMRIEKLNTKYRWADSVSETHDGTIQLSYNTGDSFSVRDINNELKAVSYAMKERTPSPNGRMEVKWLRDRVELGTKMQQ